MQRNFHVKTGKRRVQNGAALNTSERLNSKFLLLCLVVTTGAFLPTFFAWYHADDFNHLVAFNKPLGQVIRSIFNGTVYGMDGDWHYRPLTNAFLALFLRTGNAFVCRLFSVGLHFCNALLFLKVLGHISPSHTVKRPFFFLFLLFPPAVNTVLWFSALNDLLTTFFALLTTVLFLKIQQSKRTHVLDFLLIGAVYFLALLSKEISITLPLILASFSFIQGRMKATWHVLTTLSGVALCFILLRITILSGTGMNEEETALYFAFNLGTVLSLFRYFYTLVIPSALTFNFKYPLLYITALPAFICLFNALQKAPKRVLNCFLLLVALTIVAIGPLINTYNFWYLYYPSVVFLLIIAIIFRYSSEKILQPALYTQLIVYFLITFFYSFLFWKAGEHNRNILKQLHAIKSSNIRVLNVPASIGNVAPLFLVSGVFASQGMRYFYNEDKKIFFGARKCVDDLNETFVIKPLKNKNVTFSLNGNIHGQYYYRAQNDTLGVKYNFLNKNILGLPTSVQVQIGDTIPTYIHQ